MLTAQELLERVKAKQAKQAASSPQPEPKPTQSPLSPNASPNPQRTALDVAKYFRNAVRAGAFEGLVQPSLPELEQIIAKACNGDEASLEYVLELADNPVMLRLLRRASAKLTQQPATPSPSAQTETSPQPTKAHKTPKPPAPVSSLPRDWLERMQTLYTTGELADDAREMLGDLLSAAKAGDRQARGTLEFLAYKWHAERLL